MHGLRAQVFEAWLRDGIRPGLAALHAHLLARAQVAPGADGRATLAGVLDFVEPFADKALAAGFRGMGERVPVSLVLGDTLLAGRLQGVHPQGLLRVALRTGGVHGGHVLRHRLDALVASALGLGTWQLQGGKDQHAPPHLAMLPAFSPGAAHAALRALLALHRRMRRAPLPFLPKSGFVLWSAGNAPDGMRAARDQWQGSEYVHAEADAATQLALRGRDPFVDRDAASRAMFAAATTAIFAALADATPFDAVEVLP
jgi:exodeoxyribonuclease V gamma subunit